jgi:hypothetical protein
MEGNCVHWSRICKYLAEVAFDIVSWREIYLLKKFRRDRDTAEVPDVAQSSFAVHVRVVYVVCVSTKGVAISVALDASSVLVFVGKALLEDGAVGSGRVHHTVVVAGHCNVV